MLRYQIGITLIKGIGNILAKNLIAYIGSAEGVFKEKQRILAKIPGIGEVRATEILNQNVLARADEEVNFICKNNLSSYYFADKNYSFRLKECADAPIMLYGKGTIELNEGKYIGIVGTRKATELGKEYCRNLITQLAEQNSRITIVSGLAYGIDITAHKIALEVGLPTLAIPGHGLDRIYPAAHHATALKMLHNGGIVTEFMNNTNPDRQNFVQRNRIIAGLCDAVAVIESKNGGGSLITANIANSYNRDVFAFPGRPNDQTFKGCNALIKQNKAALIENAADLLRYMSWENNLKSTILISNELFSALSEQEELLLRILRATPEGIQVNELAALANKPFNEISSTLLEMEFKGIVKPLPGSVYRVVK